MGRKRDEGLFVLLMEASARLPRWLSLPAAAVFYLLLHAYATHVEPAPKDLAALGGYAGRQLRRTLALFGQYLVPAALGIGAIVSVINPGSAASATSKPPRWARPRRCST